MPNGYLPLEIFSEVMEFLQGTPHQIQKRNAARKILRWYRNIPTSEDIYLKTDIVRQILRKYNDETLFNYPQFANSKMGLYSPQRYPLPREGFTRRSQVRDWIVEHMTVRDLALVGV